MILRATAGKEQINSGDSEKAELAKRSADAPGSSFQKFTRDRSPSPQNSRPAPEYHFQTRQERVQSR